MHFENSFGQVLSKPTPSALWELRSQLLEVGFSDSTPAMIVLDHFYRFLNELVASATAREFSHFASLLDMAAVAGLALENLVGERDSEAFWKRFMLGAISEAMMVIAARQYVKAWEEEMKASYKTAAWYLSQEYWKLSFELQPDLSPDLRQQLVKDLVAPIESDDVEGKVKAAVIVRLFQLLLFARLQSNL